MEETPRFVEVQDKPGIVKDTVSGALLNTDNTGLQAYKKQKIQAEQARRDRERLEKLEADVGSMKTILQQILEKVS